MVSEHIGAKEHRGKKHKVSFKDKHGKHHSFMARKRTPKYKFPVDPKKGERHTIKNKRMGRKITFQATGKKFPKWRIIKNTPL